MNMTYSTDLLDKIKLDLDLVYTQFSKQFIIYTAIKF